MFEKDAEEYRDSKAHELYHHLFEENAGTPADFAEQCFQDGAEFAYNKANEWHYPSKGEYPKEYKNVLCYCKGEGIKFCCVGHTIVGGDNKVRWWANNKTEELHVIAWKEIVLPKESE